jgi:ABC-type spermidine/putrescine transport system permease subunit I
MASRSPATATAARLVSQVAVNRWWLLGLPAVLFVTLVYLVPLGSVLVQSVLSPEPGFQNFVQLLGSRGYQRVLLQTLWIALVATGLCLVIGYPVAYAITRAGPVARRILVIGVISPYLTSVLVRTFAWEVLLGRLGLINQALVLLGFRGEGILLTPAAVIVGLVHILLPLMILSLYSVMQGIDESLPRSARALGAGPARAFFRVYMPLTLPGIEVGCVLVFVYGVGAFITPQILGGRSGIMLGVVIQVAIDHMADLGFAAAAACLLMLVVLAVLLLYRTGMSGSIEWLAVRESIARAGRESRRRGGPRRPRRVRILPWLADVAGRGLDATGLSQHRSLLWVFTGVVLVFLVVPQLIAVPISFSSTRTLIFPPRGLSTQWYANFFSSEWLSPAITSMGIAITVSVGATLLGALAGVGVVRGLTPRAGDMATVLLLLPLLIPTVVAAVGLYLVFLDLGLTDSVLGLVLAHTALAIPFAFAVISGHVRSLDSTFERAAASLGAGRFAVLRRILFPLVRPGVFVALFLTLLFSFDEAVVAIFLSGLHVKTLPRRMFEALLLESDPTVGVVATLSLGLSVVVLLGSARLGQAAVTRRSRGARPAGRRVAERRDG